VAGALDPGRQRRRTAARIVLDHYRREHHRHGGRRRDRKRHRIVGEIAAQCAERYVGKDEGGAIIDVGGVDPDQRPRAGVEILERRAVEQMSIQPTRKCRGVVDAAVQPLGEVEEGHRGLQRLLAVREQEALLEVGQRRALSQAVIGREHRAARDAGDEVELVEQRLRAAVDRGAGLVKALEDAVGEGRGAGAATRERHRDDGVVEGRLRIGVDFGGDLPRPAGKRNVDRLVMDLSTAGRKGGKRNNTPRAQQTLEPTPNHYQKVIGAPLQSRQETPKRSGK